MIMEIDMKHIPLSDRIKQQAIKTWAEKKTSSSNKKPTINKPVQQKVQSAQAVPGINAPIKKNTACKKTIKSIFKKKKVNDIKKEEAAGYYPVNSTQQLQSTMYSTGIKKPKSKNYKVSQIKTIKIK